MRATRVATRLTVGILCTLCVAARPAGGLTGRSGAEIVPLPPLENVAATPPPQHDFRRQIDPFLGELTALERRLFGDAADGRFGELSLLSAVLIASGEQCIESLDEYQARLDVLVAELRESGRLPEEPRGKARAIFEFMHRRVLGGGYRIECTDLRGALEAGRFNCVSATVLFCCLAGELGLPVCGLEMPGHAMSRVRLVDGGLDVETTCPCWFRLMHDPQQQAEAVRRTLGQDPVQDVARAREVSPVEMAAMVYYNRGVDLLLGKRYAEAAAANAKALRLDPASATARGNLLATINNWAIQRGEAGYHPEAIALLRRGLGLDPHYEAFALNYVHVHHQWVDHLCQAGRFEEALEVLCQAAAERPEEPRFRSAPFEVYRCWVRTLLELGREDEAAGVLDEARQCWGECPNLQEAEVAAVNDRGLQLIDQRQYEQAVRLFDWGLARQPHADLLRQNRRVAVMRWAQTAFQADDYAEAIRRTTFGARPGTLHAALLDNLRYGYDQWVRELRQSGRDSEAERVAHRAAADPFLRGSRPTDRSSPDYS